MRSGVADSTSSVARRGSWSSRSGRPWLLIVGALLLAVLSTVLWAKWEESRVRAERLQAEIKQVYSEAEGLRTEAARLQQRVAQLERQLRESLASEPASKARGPRPRP
jgi:type VI protein secretion system component VasK